MPTPMVETAVAPPGAGPARALWHPPALAAVAVASAAVLAAYFLGSGAPGDGDSRHYMAMAVRGPASAPSPYAFRILTPALVSALPLAPDTGFFVLTWTASAAVLLVLRRLLRDLGIAQVPSLVAAGLAGLSYPVAFNLGAYELVDPLANLVTLATVVAAVESRWALAIAGVVLAALARESALVVVPVVLWRMHVSLGPRRWIGMLLAAALPLLVFLALRRLVEPVPGGKTIRSLFDLPRIMVRVVRHNSREFGFGLRVIYEFVRAYGFFWLTAALGWRRVPREWKPLCAYLVVAGLGVCLVGADWSRMLVAALAAIFISTACWLQGLLEGQPRAARWIGGLVGLAAVQCWLLLQPVRMTRPDMRAPLAAAIVVTFIAGTAVSLLAGRAASPSAAPRDALPRR